MLTPSQSPLALMSLRAAMASVILTAAVAWSSIVPETPDRVRWLGLFWLSVYASVMIAQLAWLGWRWLSDTHPFSLRSPLK